MGWSDTLSKTKSYERLMSQMSHLVFFVSNTQVAICFDKIQKTTCMFEMFSTFALKLKIYFQMRIRNRLNGKLYFEKAKDYS